MRRHVLVGFALWGLGPTLLWLGGCARYDLRKNIPWGEGAGKSGAPTRIVCMWSETVLHQEEQRATRGFGGRLMFYGQDAGKPIKVEGTLVVYAFDETHRDPANPVPDRRFVFTEEQLPEHYSKSRAGHSYSFWLPWDKAGGPRTDVSLIARFTPKQGGVVTSEQTRVMLPGAPRTDAPPTIPVHWENLQPSLGPPPGDPIQAGLPKPARAASSQQGEAGVERYAPQMQTTTIMLPPQFGQRPTTSATRHNPPASGPLQTPQASAEANRAGSPDAASAAPPAVRPGPPQLARFGVDRARALGAQLAAVNRDQSPTPPSAETLPDGRTEIDRTD